MNDIDNKSTFLDTRCLENVVEGLKLAFKAMAKEAFEEVYVEKMCNANLEDQRLNAEELCTRWNISKNTLNNWEKDGRIAPLPIGGRKKIYSMKDVLNAESEGLIKRA